MDSTVAVELDPAAVSPPVLGAEQHDQKMKQEGEIEVMAREFERLVEKAGLEMDPSLTGYSEVVQRIEAKVREDALNDVTGSANVLLLVKPHARGAFTDAVLALAQRGPEETT